jgi:hypothetical protein
MGLSAQAVNKGSPCFCPTATHKAIQRAHQCHLPLKQRHTKYAIPQNVDHARAHTQLLVRASERKDRGHKLSLLLRGDDLTSAEAWLAHRINVVNLSSQQPR